MTLFTAFDFETDSPKPATALVAQVAIATQDFTADAVIDKRADAVLCYVSDIPIGATAIHGIKPSDVADRKVFGEQVSLVAKMLARSEVIVTFNGLAFDLVILEREAAAADVDVSFVRARHFDAYRIWKRRQSADPRAACYSGSLAGAHLFYTGETFDGAHDARVDCRATLRVAREQLRTHALADLLRWSALPLPGYADIEGKLRWIGDVLTFASGKHAGHDIADVDRGYLQWVIDNDFPDDMKVIMRVLLAGGYPARRYEDEV